MNCLTFRLSAPPLQEEEERRKEREKIKALSADQLVQFLKDNQEKVLVRRLPLVVALRAPFPPRQPCPVWPFLCLAVMGQPANFHASRLHRLHPRGECVVQDKEEKLRLSRLASLKRPQPGERCAAQTRPPPFRGSLPTLWFTLLRSFLTLSRILFYPRSQHP